MSDVKQDPFESDTPAAAPTVPANSPISAELREAINWARANGVSEMEIPAGRFVLRAAANSAPTMADLQEKLGPKFKPVVGGFDPNLLFAASPNPYVPDSEQPIPMPGAPAEK